MEHHYQEILSSLRCVEKHVTELKQEVADLTQVIYKGNGKSLVTRMEIIEMEKGTILQNLSERSKDHKALSRKLNKLTGVFAASMLFVAVLAIDPSVGKQVLRYLFEVVKMM